MKKTPRSGTWLAGVATLLCALQAHADDTHAAQADALFQHGVELMKADQCAEAVPEFLKSEELDPSAGTLLNLGTCYARLGRKATAYKAYEKAAKVAQTEKNEALRERAVQAMAILAPTLTKVQIVTPKSAGALSLRLNGEELIGYDGLPIPLDAGESVIEAAAPGHEPWRHSVTANDNDLGATVIVHVPELAPVPQAAPGPAVYVQPVDERPDLRVPAVIVGGVGLASIVTGAIFGVAASSTYSDSEAYCTGNRCLSQGIDLRDRASTQASVATWTITLGLVATATGVVLWLTSPTHSASNRALKAPSWQLGGTEFGMLINEHR